MRRGHRKDDLERRGIPVWAVLAVIGAIALGWRMNLGNSQPRALGGFDLEFCTIPRDEIRAGGPPKDGIPALTNPAVLPAVKADFLEPGDLVIGVDLNGQSRAYPLNILTWHENVNDTLGGVPIAVTYCPLCNSGVVFDRRVGGEVREFGVSGLLWNSNVLLYDRRPGGRGESLWSQLALKAICGPAARRGLRLSPIPSEVADWSGWRFRHPGSTVLSTATGHARDYSRNPYSPYFKTGRILFSVSGAPDGGRYHDKENLVVLTVASGMKGYALRDIARVAGAGGTFEDSFAGSDFRFRLDPSTGSVRVERIGGADRPYGVAYSFWFAWRAINPAAEVFEPPAIE